MYYRLYRLLKLFGIILCLILIFYEVFHLFFDSTEIVLKKDFEEICENLPSFNIRLPNFSDDEAKKWFYSSTYYKINSKNCPKNSCEENGFLFNNTKEHLTIKISFIKNGLYLNDDCGYNYDDISIKRIFRNENETTIIYDKVIIYTVPDGWSFQHFLDGIGPKLSHSRFSLEKYPDAKILIIQGPRFDRSVKEIWSMLG
jgi:hypothetical protein